MKSSRPNLSIFTALSATVGQRDGTFVLTHKFLDGVMEYVRSWPGTISVWVRHAQHTDSHLDCVEINPDDLPFRLSWLEGSDDARFYPALDEADSILAALVPEFTNLAELCVERSISLVYITELSVLTRRQIVRSGTRNPLLRWRREYWAVNAEKRYCRAVSLATGIQCNGLPTFSAYSEFNQHCLLYFDSRVRSNQLVRSEKLDRRLWAMRNGQPLRLGFSGRLIAIKGVDHLVLVARELQRLCVPFTMDICGGGELEPRIRRDIRRFGLENQVRMHGVLDFENELLPFVADNIDLFVCCHRQGDPSCTYLETYSCGVPVVGYANEAFSGLVAESGVGGKDWATPMDAPVLLARKIADLNSKRKEIEIASRDAVAFAALHTFENTMARRVQHLLERHADHEKKVARLSGRCIDEDPMPNNLTCHDLSCVIVNYRTPHLVLDCLKSLLPELTGTNARVVVVDNHSGDDSPEVIRAWLAIHDAEGRTTLVQSSKNAGFAAGNNIGIKTHRALHYLLLNSDALVRPGAIRIILDTATRFPEAGLISPRLEWQDGEGQESCFRFPSPFSELSGATQTGLIDRLLGRYIVALPVQTQIARPQWTSFACVLIKDEVLRQVGLLDEGYFMYFEDVEFCYRAHKAGWQIVHNPEAQVVHLRGGSSVVKKQTRLKKRVPRYFYESRSRYFYQSYGWFGLTSANLLWWLGRLVSGTRQLLGRPDKAVIEKQWLDIWINWLNPLRSYSLPKS